MIAVRKTRFFHCVKAIVNDPEVSLDLKEFFFENFLLLFFEFFIWICFG